MKLPVTLLLVLVVFTIQSVVAQERITPAEASAYVGKIVIVCGEVSGTKYLQNSASKLTFLNMGGQYPNHTFTIVISEEARQNFDEKPEEYYQNKDLCVTGKIEMYNGTPQIRVLNPLELPLNYQNIELPVMTPKQKERPTNASTTANISSTTASSSVLKKATSLRSGPGASFEVVKALKAGQQIVVMSSKKGWAYVQLRGKASDAALPIKGFVPSELVQ